MNNSTTPDEHLLRRLYADVLKVDSVGLDDSFFALAGDSIAVMRLVSRARAAGFDIGISDVFEAKTVRGLAAIARAGAVPETGTREDTRLGKPEPSPTEPEETATPQAEGVYRLTPLQEGLYFQWLYKDGEDSYIHQGSLDVRGPLDPHRLRTATESVVGSLPNLRAGFRTRPDTGELIQVVPDGVKPSWITSDLSHVRERDRDTELKALLKHELRREFDLAEPPLLRCLLVKSGTGHHQLVVTYHHILLDGWSAQLLLGKIMDTYDAAGPIPDAAEEHPNPYAEYGGWLARQDRLSAAEAWRSYLQDVRAGTRVGPAQAMNVPSVSRRTTKVLDRGITDRLHQHARECDLTLNILVQTAWGLLLSQLCRQDEVLFGRTVAGRPPELSNPQRMIGMFANVVPTRLRPDPAETILRLCTRVQAEQSKLMRHDHLGLSDIQELCGQRDLFDTLYSFQSFHTPSNATRDLQGFGKGVRIVSDGHSAPHYPLILTVFAQHDRLAMRFLYAGDVFDDAVVEELGDGIALLLSRMAGDRAVLVEEVNRLSVPLLPWLAGTRAAASGADAGPQPSNGALADVERLLIAQYSVVLGIPENELTADDDFFELGGHSLLAARLVSRIHAKWGAELSVRTVFDHPVVADLARELSAAADEGRPQA
ncbi:condensation domain-containing protein [Nonomuraea sp. NPDC046802]|uniref:condensation domain-containing protein n=1 Tax=Nonomuraea sp. NPDC046802 TaxID=3154919 RepID=UPI0033D82CD4